MPIKKLTHSDIGQLREKIEDLGYSKNQSAQVASISSPGNTLKKLIGLHPRLIELGFSHNKIIRIAAHRGGAKNLDAIIKYYQNHHENLPADAQLTPKDLRQIVGHEGGSKNLESVIQYYQNVHFKLQEDEKLRPENLLKIVCHHGGSINLNTVSQYLLKIQKSLPCEQRLKRNELVDITSRSGGHKNLALYVHCYLDMINLGLEKFELLKFFRQMTHKNVKSAISDWLSSLMLSTDLEFHRRNVLNLLSTSYTLTAVNISAANINNDASSVISNGSNNTNKRPSTDENNAMLLLSLSIFSVQKQPHENSVTQTVTFPSEYKRQKVL